MMKNVFFFALLALAVNACTPENEQPHFSTFIDLTLKIEDSEIKEDSELAFSIVNSSTKTFSKTCQLWLSISNDKANFSFITYYDLNQKVFSNNPLETNLQIEGNARIKKIIKLTNLINDNEISFSEYPEGEYSIALHLMVLSPGDPENQIQSEIIKVSKAI